MSTNLTYTEDKWLVCHNNGSNVSVIPIKAGETLGCGKTNHEEFDTEGEAISRAQGLGWVSN